MRELLRVTSTGGDPAVSATVIPFALRHRGRPEAASEAAVSGRRFTPSDCTALIALGYALAGWEVTFEEDGYGMQWAALCPSGGNGAARYIVGRDGGILVLLSASGQILGTYGTSVGLVQDVRCWEAANGGQQRGAARPWGTLPRVELSPDRSVRRAPRP